jgi:two-component system sensor histidine kinase PilS (NtrC family)
VGSTASRADRHDALEVRASKVSGDLEKRLLLLMGARLALSILCLAIAAALEAAGWSYTPAEWRGFYGTVAFAFVATIVYGLCLGRVTRVKRFAAINIATDIALVSALVHLSGGSDSPFAFLYVMVAVYGAVLFDRTGAVVCAAASAAVYGIVLLAEQHGWLPARTIGAPDPAPVLLGMWVVNAGGVILVAGLASLLSAELRRTGEALKQRTSDLSRLQTLHQRTVESLMSGLLTTNEAGRITLFNPEAERITQLSHEEVIGKSLEAVLPGIHEFVVAATEGGRMLRSRARMSYPVQGERTRHLGVGAYALRDGESTAGGHVVIFQDVTDVVEMEQNLRRSERLAAIGELSASIAHEIRNPLAAISGSIEMLHSGRNSESAPSDPERLMKIVLREVDRLDHLITGFLQYARPEPRRVEAIDLRAAVGDVMEMFDAARSDAIETDVSVAGGLVVHADAAQLRQVLWNLVLNAAQAMPDGGRVRLSAGLLDEKESQEAQPGDRRAQEEGKESWVEIVVADDGIGIPADQMDRIFDPFFTTKPSGSGLGLATVHRIIEDHGGTVRLESQLGVGTTFRIRFPAAGAST